MTMNNQNPFGEIIYAYTRSQAVADGVQIDVTKTAQEAGIKFPMFLTRAVFDNYVAVPEGVTSQDEAGRLFDLVWMTRFAILRARGHTNRLPVALYVRNDNQRQASEIDCHLRAARCGRPITSHHFDVADRELSHSSSTRPVPTCRAPKIFRLTAQVRQANLFSTFADAPRTRPRQRIKSSGHINYSTRLAGSAFRK
jgi:hypothetical protein